MKNLFATLSLLIIASSLYAQETLLVNEKLPNKLTAVYNVLKTDNKIKQGLYQVRRDKKTAVVSGVYNNNKKAGIWHFFDQKGTLIQNFNYDTNQLTYEAPDTPTDGFKYIFDKDFLPADTVTKPMRIGGRYYGYLPYLKMFKRPFDLNNTDPGYLDVFIELLVSPGGILADYNIHISSNYYNFDRTLSVNLNLLPIDDKLFIPATINRQAVASRITIPCHIDNNGSLVF